MNWNNRQEVLDVVREGTYIEFASPELRDDKELILEAVKNDGINLCWASDRLKNDKEIVLTAVEYDGKSLEFASDELKDDKEFMMKACKINGYALEFASDRLKNDREVVLEACKNNKSIFYSLEEIKKEFESVEDFFNSEKEEKNPWENDNGIKNDNPWEDKLNNNSSDLER